MIKSIPVRAAILIITIFVALVSLYPTMVGMAGLPDWWKKLKFMPQKSIKLGLDLRGGIYLVYTIKLDEVAALEAQTVVEVIDNEESQKEGISISNSVISDDGQVRITFADEASKQKGGSYAADRFGAMWDIRADKDDPLTLVFDIKPLELEKAKKSAIQQVRRTVSSRVDEWGLAETSVIVKPPDQLIVELPGITDTERVDEVIKTTANLELKLVQDSASSRETLIQQQGGRISRRMDIYESKNAQTGIVETYLLLKKKPDVTGACISGARMGFGGNFGNQAIVFFNLKPGGDCAGKFARLTSANIGKQLAIVLDNQVMSAPVIRGRISDSGIIEGQFTTESATDLAIILKTGSLKVPVVKDRVERIGPSLGADHIQRGKIAIIMGSIFVIVFMVIYYKAAGAVADLALILNILFIMAALATFGATLTLPGLAGIVLTIGMAVDANVLIFERIREEARTGKTPQSSVELGYSRAFITIIDANITTFITAVVLYVNGTGPIKGFAVTLMFGIISSLFTSIFVTRILFDYRLERHIDRELSI